MPLCRMGWAQWRQERSVTMTVVDAPSPLRSRPRINRRLKARLAVVPGVVLLATATLAWFTTAQAAEAPVPLGTAESYAILAGSTITNTGNSDIIGDVGLSPGTDVTGFPPGEIFGALNIANGAAGTAKMDLTAAYNNAAKPNRDCRCGRTRRTGTGARRLLEPDIGNHRRTHAQCPG